MRVIVDGKAGIVIAEETDNLNALSVQLRSTDAQLAAKVLGNFGRMEGSHVWLDIESLKTLAPLPRSCSWDERFAKTMAYARSKGWVDETGKFVRAHIDDGEA